MEGLVRARPQRRARDVSVVGPRPQAEAGQAQLRDVDRQRHVQRTRRRAERAQAAQGTARDARVDDIFRVSRRCEECEECFKPERRHFDAFLQNSPQLLDHQLQDDAFCSAAAAFSTLVGPPVRKVTVLAGNQIRLRDASLVRESSLLVAVDHVLEHALGRTGLLDSNHPKQNGKSAGCDYQ